MHNGEVPLQTQSLSRHLHTTARLWQHSLRAVEPRGVRKVVVATMFTTIALVYIGQLAMWGIFIPITPEAAQFTGTPFSTLAAATAGMVYLWRTGIPYSVEITFVAIVAAHFIQQPLLPFVYSVDFTRGEFWFVFAYIMFALSLCTAYILSYGFFTSWRTSTRNRLIFIGLFMIAAVTLQGAIKAGVS